MSSASAASSSAAAATTAKKVEWYHLDRVAIAKRICLDPLAVKLKTALNNNNNNNNVNSGGGHGNSSSPSSLINSNTSIIGTNSNNNSKATKTGKSPYDHSRLNPKAGLEGNKGGGTKADATKSVFSALRYSASNSNSASSVIKSIPPNFLNTAGGRQFAALQLKRRRKAARAAGALANFSSSATAETQQKEQDSSNSQRSCKRLLDEDGLLVNSGTKIGGGGTSCGSSSRSSSSGVASDFEEVDSGSSSSIMKGTSSASHCGGGGESSSSECEEDDEESSIQAFPSLKKKNHRTNNKSVSGGSSSNSSGNNSGSLSNLNILNSVSVMVESVGASGGRGGNILSKTAALRTGNWKVGYANCKVTCNNNVLSGVVVNSKMRTEVLASNKNGTKSGGGGPVSFISSSSTSCVDNDRDTDVSFSEFTTDLDFISMMDKGKRRTDRYDSSESSDSGVATLSPSTSDSPELSTCCDFTPEHLEVGISASRSSSSLTTTCSSSYPTINSSKASSSSSSSSSSSCSGTSAACLTETQGEPGTGTVPTTTTNSSTSSSSTAGTNTIIEASLPSSTGSDSTCSSLLQTNPPVHQETLCLWKGCTCSTTEASHNILEHIQTTHVAPQMKTAGYVCLWEGCKVYNKRSSSLSWLERHVLSHSGNKPFKCIFPGCGLSFSSQTALERHVNSHIATNGTTNGTQGNSTVANKKIDASPAKSSRRKKMRFRKQRVNIGQRVDYFDKRIMEVIKHWLASSVDQFAANAHDCTFRAEILARRVIAHCERQVLVRWHPRFILPDEWMSESKVSKIKLVPLRQIPSDKIRLLYPSLFPPTRTEKASRKRKPRSNISPFLSSTSSHSSERSSLLTTLPPSPSSETSPSCIDADPYHNSTRSTRSSSSSIVSMSSSVSVSSSSSFTTNASSLINKTTTSTSSSKSIADAKKSSEISFFTSKEAEESETEREEDKCHKKFCGSSSCDCPSVLLASSGDQGDEEEGSDDQEDNSDNSDYDTANSLESSHWALKVLYEDCGMSSS